MRGARRGLRHHRRVVGAELGRLLALGGRWGGWAASAAAASVPRACGPAGPAGGRCWPPAAGAPILDPAARRLRGPEFVGFATVPLAVFMPTISASWEATEKP